MKSAASTNSIQSCRVICPRTSRSTANDVIPNDKPLAIENVNGIVISVRNAGTATIGSVHSISVTAEIINEPTRINAGAVAAIGIVATSGATNNAIRNNSPVTIEPTPVPAPTTTTAA